MPAATAGILLVLASLIIVALALLVVRARRRIARLAFLHRGESDLLRPYLDGQHLETPLDAADCAYLHDSVVFVVGAGGSIAGELVAQLTGCRCRQVVLIDNNENGLYALRRRLAIRDPGLHARTRVELANVRDRDRIDALFDTYRPNVVFHYANYKSAALGNHSPYGFVLVNVGGTRNVLRAVDRTPSVRRVVYISSDKAQEASQTYGRTKRVAELMVLARAQHNDGVRYAILRYCNVLDAAGSFAIPTFRQQIAAGQPVTVRRLPDGDVPDRYFITLTVAARLAVRAGATAGRGTVLSLDERRVSPLPIDDLVVILARAFGVRDVDRWFRRNVRFVAAEPGEKRSEALGVGTPVPGAPLIELAAPGPIDAEALDGAVSDLLSRTRGQAALDGIPQRLAEIIDEFGSVPAVVPGTAAVSAPLAVTAGPDRAPRLGTSAGRASDAS
jgi:nucleoside-diphosphate-sugar epimerase